MNTGPSGLPPPRPELVRAYARAAPHYDRVAVIQKLVQAELSARLDAARLAPTVIVDVGAGTGTGTRLLKKRYRRSLVVGMDLSAAMLGAARRKRGFLAPFELCVADAIALPLRSASVDLACSSLALQWLGAPGAWVRELARVLKPGAALYFATLGPESFGELREACTVLGRAMPAPPDLGLVGAALLGEGFVDPVLDVERYTLSYASLRAALTELRWNGGLLRAGPGRGLTRRATLAALEAAYPGRDADGRLTATVEVIFGRAVRGAVRERGVADEQTFPVGKLKRRIVPKSGD